MREKASVGKNIKTWLCNQNNWTIITSVVAIIALVVAIVALLYTARQVGIAMSNLEVSISALDTIRADLEAKTRPYLSIENIREEERGDKWVSIMVGVINRGELPATSVQLDKIVIGGEHIAWVSDFDEDYPAVTHTTDEGITITTGGIILPPARGDFPSDIIFYPNKLNTIEIVAYGTTWRSTITDGSIIDIGLTYAWGSKQYWYVATAILSNGEWNINLERGD